MSTQSFPISKLEEIKNIDSAEIYSLLSLSFNGVESAPVNLLNSLAEKQVNYRKYKLNSYLIKDLLIEHWEDISNFMHQRSRYYLSEKNELTTLTEHLRTK